MTAHLAASPTSPLTATLEKYFETKTGADVEGTMGYFSPNLATYSDATLGWDFSSYEALKAVFAQYMPHWSHPARSYATRVLGNDSSPGGFDNLPSDDPTPEEAALLAEEVETLLARLRDPLLRQLAVWKLEGYTNAEIATRLDCSEPTVRRRLAIIRRLLKSP